jgi:antitoxin VapB
MIYIKENKMARTAKLFRNGRSQAVRLPSDFRFDGDEVYIRRDAATGDVVLSRRPDSWDGFFALADRMGIAEDFLAGHHDQHPQKRELFG